MFRFPLSRLRRSYKSVFTIVLFVALLLAACGGDDEPTPTTAPATAAPTTAPAAPESPLQPASPLQSSSTGNNTPSVVSASAPEAADYTMAQPEIPESKADMGTVVGRLVSSTTDVALNHEIVRLAEVECPEDVAQESKRTECVWMLSNAFSPSTFTDENGFFVFNDVPPRDYVVIVGDMMNKNTKLADDGGPFMWAAVENKITDIGEYHIEW